MSTRKLLKLKYALDSLDLETKQMGVKIRQFRVDLLTLRLELKMRKEAEEPVVSIEEVHTHDSNEVNFDLPPTFDEYEEQEEEMESMVEETHTQEHNEVNFDLPPKFDEYEELEEENDQEDIVEEVVDDDQSACESFIIMDSPQELELEEGGPSLFSNGARHENQELDWTLPLKFDEQEDDKLQVSELQPCNVVEELEPPSPQKECPNSQQELRTILFKERGNDVYSLGVHFHLCNSTPWELSPLRTHTWKYSIWTLWFEFHDKRHVMEFYLARTKLKQSNSALGTSPGIKSAFVHLLVQDPLD